MVTADTSKGVTVYIGVLAMILLTPKFPSVPPPPEYITLALREWITPEVVYSTVPVVNDTE
tara:strand:- start:289 stop:471 length:183 start_codon:yes stop_codon:yes gene_type:complete